MLPDEATIKSLSKNVYLALVKMLRCTFAELQSVCELGSTELCLCIARLLQENKIRQERCGGNVYYLPCFGT